MSVFFEKNVKSDRIELSEEESRHCSQVLRHQKGDEVIVITGDGTRYFCTLIEVSKRKCVAEVLRKETYPRSSFRFHLAIAPTKNIDRMEWLVEKLCELGADEITLLETAHSERRKIRMDRLEKKAIGAMKQSGNPFLPRITSLTKLTDFLRKKTEGQKMIAHVDRDHKYIGDVLENKTSLTLLIGPEGDFSAEELSSAIAAGYQPVSLGQTTLRTETAGLKACCFFAAANTF